MLLVPVMLFFRFMLANCDVPLESQSMAWLSAWRRVDHVTL